MHQGGFRKTRRRLACLIKAGEKVWVSVCVFVSELGYMGDVRAKSLTCNAHAEAACTNRSLWSPPSNKNHLVINRSLLGPVNG